MNEASTTTARTYWRKARLASRITLKLGPALQTIRALPVSPSLDFAFIDADKENYLNYYEEIPCPNAVRRTNPDRYRYNVLWGGAVLESRNQNADTRAIRELNDLIARDERVDAVMLAVADGVTVCRRK